VAFTGVLKDHDIQISMDGKGRGLIWNKLLRDYPTCVVGVYCSLDVTAQREVGRLDRMPGSSAEQYFRVHEGVEYDLKLDTTNETPRSWAAQIVEYVAEHQS
jgi:chloramphenicol 3-O phosphotransferase